MIDRLVQPRWARWIERPVWEALLSGDRGEPQAINEDDDGSDASDHGPAQPGRNVAHNSCLASALSSIGVRTFHLRGLL